ncbi:1003_t:CDS:2 [Funneliformis geosporum]|nr:1003_t:CDS:2 [Funneliformis geosporum]
MATLSEVLNSIASLLVQISQYVGQELSDNYYNYVIQAINYGHSLGVYKKCIALLQTKYRIVKLDSA